LAQNVQSPEADGVSHVFHQIQGEGDVVQTQEPGRRGLVDLEEMAQVSPAVALADIAGTSSVNGVVT
jgi:hypothetical protein